MQRFTLLAWFPILSSSSFLLNGNKPNFTRSRNQRLEIAVQKPKIHTQTFDPKNERNQLPKRENTFRSWASTDHQPLTQEKAFKIRWSVAGYAKWDHRRARINRCWMGTSHTRPPHSNIYTIYIGATSINSRDLFPYLIPRLPHRCRLTVQILRSGVHRPHINS